MHSLRRNGARHFSAVALQQHKPKAAPKYDGVVTSKIMQCTSPHQLSSLLRKIKKEDEQHFSGREISLAIKRLTQWRDYRAAFSLFNDVKNQTPSKLDHNLYSIAIRMCLDQYGHNIDTDSLALQKKRIKALASSTKLFFEMQHQYNIEPNEYVLCALLSNCARVITKKSLRMAEHHWQRLMHNEYEHVQMDHVVWNAMLNVYLKHYKLNAAIDLLQSMAAVENGVAASMDHTTYLLLLNGVRLNCAEFHTHTHAHAKEAQAVDDAHNSNEYAQHNLSENAISKTQMRLLTVQTVTDCVQQLGAVPTLEIFGCVLNNFAMLGEVDTCVSLLCLMRHEWREDGDDGNEACDMHKMRELGLLVDDEEWLKQIPGPNLICYNLCLKAIVMHADQLLAGYASGQMVPFESAYLDWPWIQSSILRHVKNLDYSEGEKRLFVTYKLLFQIAERKMECMLSWVKYITLHINDDENIQQAYLSKQYQREIVDILQHTETFFEEMTKTYKFKPHQKMFDQIYKIGFKFSQMYNEHHALFDDMESDPLKPFNEWLVQQMKHYGVQ